MAALEPPTPMTLLERLRMDPRDEAAWREFVDRYQPRIRQWCLARNVQSADADDISQLVLVKLADTMRAFQYDPAKSFRAWLKTITHNALVNFVLSENRLGHVGGEVLDSVQAKKDLEKQLQSAYDLELLDIAIKKVRNRVDPSTWEAFRLTALDGLTGAETSTRVGMPVAHVFVAKNRVQRMLQEEIKRLEDKQNR